MDRYTAYIPLDRRQAMAAGETLPDRMDGSVLVADIHGFTAFTEALIRKLGPRHGADQLTRQLNTLYGTLIAQVHAYGGSVIGFSGDAITCWFNADQGQRAARCGLTIQQVMSPLAAADMPDTLSASLGIKAGIASGSTRRFRVGSPEIQYLDVLAGATTKRAAAAEHAAKKGEVLVSPEIVDHLGQDILVKTWRQSGGDPARFAVVDGPVLPPDSPLMIDQAAHRLHPDQIRPWLLPPIYERLDTAEGHFLAEIRPVVALFLKFNDLDYDRDDAAGEKLDSYIQWVQRSLAAYEGYLIQLTFDDKGSYLYATFGAPVAHDDDIARAAAAAVELRSAPTVFDFIDRVQIGLSQGRARTGPYGSAARQTYGVLGDEVNVAARLMASAAPGEVLISQRIARAIAEDYRLSYVGPAKFKGKPELVPVSRLLDRRLAQLDRPALDFRQPLVGREEEMARLDQSLATVQAGAGQLVRLEGAAGVGKSHLIAKLAEKADQRGFQVAVGSCQRIYQNIAYHPWQQLMRTLFGLVNESLSSPWPLTSGGNPTPADDSLASSKKLQTTHEIQHLESAVQGLNPDWLLRLPLLGDLLNLPIPENSITAAFTPQLRQEALTTLAVEMIRAWAADRPLLLIIEDAHWLDEASSKLLLALNRVMSNFPVLVLLVHRPRTDRLKPKPLFTSISQLSRQRSFKLKELSPVDVAGLIANQLHGPVTPLTVSMIQTFCQGNPFFIQEMVNTLREAGALYLQPDGCWNLSGPIFNALRQANCLVKENGHWLVAPEAQLSAVDLGIPESIHGTVLSRLDRLSETSKLALKVASVIGYKFELELLLQAYPLRSAQEILVSQLNELSQRGFIHLDSTASPVTYAFNHNIIQEIVYQTLLEDQRSALHQAVGAALEQFQPNAIQRLAYHFYRSPVRAKSLLYLEKAARKLQQEYANETALNYYDLALALETRWEWLKGKAEILHILGRREEERTELAALSKVSDAPTAQVSYLWGQYHLAVGDYDQALAAIVEALAAIRAGGNRLDEGRCLAQLGQLAARQGDYDQAKIWYDQALALFENPEISFGEEARLVARILNGLGTLYRQQGIFEPAKNAYEQALTLSRQSADRQLEAEAFNHLGATAYYQRLFEDAQQYHLQALIVRRTIGDQVGEGTSLTNLAQVTRDAGDYGQAQNYLETALKLLQATGDRWQEVNTWNDLGILHQELGNLPEARRCLQQGLHLSQEIGDEVGQAYLQCNLGLVVRDQGDLKTAEQLLRTGLQVFEKEDNQYAMSFFLSYLSTISLQAAQFEQAIEQARAALTIRRALDMHLNTPDDLALLAKAHLMNGALEEAVSCARQALTILDECQGQGPEFSARDYFLVYQVFAVTGDSQAARAALQAAYDLVISRAGNIIDPALRQSFLEQVGINRDIIAEARRQEAQP